MLKTYAGKKKKRKKLGTFLFGYLIKHAIFLNFVIFVAFFRNKGNLLGVFSPQLVTFVHNFVFFLNNEGFSNFINFKLPNLDGSCSKSSASLFSSWGMEDVKSFNKIAIVPTALTPQNTHCYYFKQKYV